MEPRFLIRSKVRSSQSLQVGRSSRFCSILSPARLADLERDGWTSKTARSSAFSAGAPLFRPFSRRRIPFSGLLGSTTRSTEPPAGGSTGTPCSAWAADSTSLAEQPEQTWTSFGSFWGCKTSACSPPASAIQCLCSRMTPDLHILKPLRVILKPRADILWTRFPERHLQKAALKCFCPPRIRSKSILKIL